MLRGYALFALLVVVFISGCGGGSKATFITQYPRWDWQQYKRIAVLPFYYEGKEPGGAEAARQATYRLRDDLATNGNFIVLDREALKDVLTEQDLSQLAGVADPSTVIPAGKIQSAQAIITGTITQYAVNAERKEFRRPVYATDNKGRIRRTRDGRPIVVREEVYESYELRGTVAGSVRVVETATNKVIFAHSVPAISHEDKQGGRPSRGELESLAQAAAMEVAADCYAHIAPIQVRTKVKGDSVFVALDYYDGEYEKVKKLPLNVPRFLLVVRQLPKECDRNNFRIAIAPEEGRNIYEQEFVWSSANPVRGESWEVPLDLLTNTGGRKFVAKLYSGSGESPILTRDFELEEPKKD